MNTNLQELLDEEQELQFLSFNEETAWMIGSWLVNHAREKSYPVTIDIRRGEHMLFHVSMPGTSADNDEWVNRKVRLVNRFGHSSFYMGQQLKSWNTTIEQAFLIPEREYAPHGGCFPILIKGTGLVGTITISGLAQEQDHQLVVTAIKEHL